jgi:uncharacterized repeat protein (TIGR03803 family)
MFTKLISLLGHCRRSALLACIFSAVSAYATQVAAPTFSPVAGTYSSTQSVTINTTSGATVRYTTDGSTPTETTGILYSGTVSINSTTTLHAIAYESGFTDSTVASGLYTITSSPATVVNVLYNFTGSNDGASPHSGLIQGADNNFYGTTFSGGVDHQGTVFKLTPSGALTTLASFNGTNGATSWAGLVLGRDGNFYGTTYYGGSRNDGTIFQMTPAGVLTTIASFDYSNGANPKAGLIQGSDGNFYGTTYYGGNSGDGLVFRITPSGSLTSLVSFDGANGSNPGAALVQGTDGNFYGTTYYGGSANAGTVFMITPTGVLTTLVSFNNTNGSNPEAALVQGTDGNFYGTTYYGGDSYVAGSDLGYGTVFKVTPAGVLTTLVSFNGINGAQPWAGLVQGSNGNFYGTTQLGGDCDCNAGTVFQMTPAGILTTLLSFDTTNGDQPLAGLIQGSDGNFYGTTYLGDVSNFNDGVAFQVILPASLPAVSAPVFNPAPGAYTSTQTVSMTSATSGTSIRYTTDGSTPTETNGILYSGPVSISSTTTLKAIAYELSTDSTVTSGAYTINTSASTPTSTSTQASTSATGSSGGGGAFDDWFLGFLVFAGLWRALTRANHKRP